MTKSDRYLFIRDLCRKVSKPKVAVLVALPAEIAEETILAARHNDDQSIIDVDVEVSTISPELARVTGEAEPMVHVRAGEECLTSAERKQAKQDLMDYRAKQAKRFWIVPVGFFSHPVFSS